MCNVSVNGVAAHALLDTGSQITTISANLAKECQCQIFPLHNLITVRTAGGNELPYLGFSEINLNLVPSENVTVNVPALVVNDDKCDPEVPIVVGTNVLQTINASSLNGKNIGKPLARAISWLATSAPPNLVGYLRAQNVHTLPPKSKLTVQGVPDTKVKFARVNAITETAPEHQLPGGILVSHCLVRVGKGVQSAAVELVNVSSRERTIQQGAVLCSLNAVDVEATQSESSPQEDDSWLDKFTWPEDPEHAKAIRDIVIRFRDVFSTHSLDYGHTDLVEHRINLTDETPIKVRHRRIPPAMYDDVRQYLDELLAAKQIRPSSSPWSFPMVLVKKRDNSSLRLCVDYRLLNAVCVRDSFSLPRLDETLDALVGAKWFSKLDLRSGYYQISVYEPHKERTAFSAGPLGFYEWNSMPMGTVNATATFQRLMQQCLGNMHLKECVVFLDDILVYSSDLQSHLQRLINVFQRLRDCGLKLKPSKCEFLKTHCNYLGHVVSAEGISTDPDKIAKVRDWPVPTTAKQLSSFLGFAGFYRRFVTGFSSIAKPLQDSLKSADAKGKVPWSKEAGDAFAALKQRLTSAPVLAYADYTKPFILHIDGSGSALGAILYQEQEGAKRVIAYASRGLNQAERNYPAHKREFLALKWAVVDKFHDYLYMNKCDVYTDSNPLTYVLTTAKLDATGHRWLAHLSSYDLTLHYKPGSSNVDADALSRLDFQSIEAICQSIQVDGGRCLTLPLGPDVQNDVAGTILHSGIFDGDLASCQDDDPTLNKVKLHLNNASKITSHDLKLASPEVQKLLKQEDKLVLKSDVLYRRIIDNDCEIFQCVIPVKYRKSVFQSLHHQMGHPGRDKTLALHRARCYWPSMTKDVLKMTQTCRRCVCRKTRSAFAPLVPIVTSQPLELVCIDFLLVEPSEGYEHILVMTDHFTKFARAIPTKNESALTTARALYHNFITVYGAPARILADQGRNFESKLIKELCSLTGTSKSRTTPYHAMGNGACERFNQTLLKMLGTLSRDKKAKWKNFLPSMVHAYNCTPHEATGFSPYELMFGRKPSLPIDAELKPAGEAASLSKFVSSLQEHIKYAQEFARRRMSERAATTKDRYDKRAVAAILRPGDTVLIRKTVSTGREKLGDKWIDELHVVIDQPNSEIPVYRVKPVSASGRTKTLHRNLLLPVDSCDEDDDLTQDDPIHSQESRPKPSYETSSSATDSNSESDEEVLFIAPPRKVKADQTQSLHLPPHSPQRETPRQSISTPQDPAPPAARRSGRLRRPPARLGDYDCS